MLIVPKKMHRNYLGTQSEWIEEASIVVITDAHKNHAMIRVLGEGMNQKKDMKLNNLIAIYELTEGDKENFHLDNFEFEGPVDLNRAKRISLRGAGNDPVKAMINVSEYGKYISIESNSTKSIYVVLAVGDPSLL